MTGRAVPGRVLVTGGSGFIGNAVVRCLIETTAAEVLNLDALTYAAAPEALEPLAGNPRYRFVQADIRDRGTLDRVFAEFAPGGVIHLAAQTHVDRSLDSPQVFIETNVVGTFTLLESAFEYWRRLPASERDGFRFVHVSTDEVFGELGPDDPPFTAASPYRPRSPYAASKAAADHLVRAWHTSYGFPALVTNSSNNYGPWQYPEKFIPVVITRALAGSEIPIYGSGEQVRDWLHVDDHARGLVAALGLGQPGETYLYGGRNEWSNRALAELICEVVDEFSPSSAEPRRYLIREVRDRLGHDFRYGIEPTEAGGGLVWCPVREFSEGLSETVRWYIEHLEWVVDRTGLSANQSRQGLMRSDL